MADKIHLNILSADGAKLEKMVSYVSIPTESGPVGVLAGHLPMLCAVKQGVVKCRFGQNETMRIAVGGGIARIADNEAEFLVSGAEEIRE